jgi:predicted RND superfamily exporter protein
MQKFFGFIADHPRSTLAAVLALTALSAAPIAWIRFDNRPDAFIPKGHPALVEKQRVEAEFGLRDPMVLALTTGAPDGIFRPGPLGRLKSITEEVLGTMTEMVKAGEIPPVGDHPVYSIATEKSVQADGDLPEEFPFLEPFPRTPEDFQRLKKSIFDLELYNGVIVSEDGSAAAVVVMPPPDHAEPVYRRLEAVAARARAGLDPGEEIHLAGEAAVRSAMGAAVARDGYRFNPICFAVVTLFLYLAFRNLIGVLLPLLVVGGSIVLMLGVMCLCGKPVYIITNAIAVTVMSIGVASSMHLLAEFYEVMRERGPGAGKRELVVEACHKLWVPVLFTTATDVAGFASTFVSGLMPPLEWFGLFSAVGLGAVLLFAWTAVPASLMLADITRARHQRLRRWALEGPIAQGLRSLGLWCYDHHRTVLVLGAAAFALGAVGASRIRANQSMGSAFSEKSAIVRADRALNRLFQGTYFLDVLLQGESPGDLLRPEVLRKIEELEAHARTIPQVGGTVSVAGFARKIHQVLNHNRPEENHIAATAEAVREELELIRQRSPTKLADLRRVIDDRYQVSNVRIRVRSGEFVDEAVVVESMESFLRSHFAGLPVSASLAGRVNMDYHWMKLVLRSNAGNVALSLVLVIGCMVLMFRSVWGGLYCLVPVALAVLYTYGVMGFAGIDLSISTSMFAAIATGVGVDYPTHLLDRLRVRIGLEGAEPRAAIAETFGLAGKTVLFNAAAVAFGFLVLTVAELPLLVRFGIMIAVGIIVACLASLTLLPALVRQLEPAFIYRPRRPPAVLRSREPEVAA